MLAVRSLTVLVLILDIYLLSAETLIINTADDGAETLSLQDDKTIIKRTGSHHGTGTGCVVKGSYCQCHYCKVIILGVLTRIIMRLVCTSV